MSILNERNKPIVIGGIIIAVVTVVFAIFAIRSTPVPQRQGINEIVVNDTPAVKIVKPIDLTGSWTTTDKNKIMMNAKIEDHTIDIEMGNDSTRAAYWYGSFPEINDGETITSNVLDNGKLYLSSAKTKEFVYKDGKITFEFKALGTTQTVEMTRV